MFHQNLKCMEGLFFYGFLNCAFEVVILLDLKISFIETCLLHNFKSLVITSTKIVNVRSSWPSIFLIFQLVMNLNGLSYLTSVFKTNITETLTQEDFLFFEEIHLLHFFKAIKHQVSQISYLDTSCYLVNHRKNHDCLHIFENILLYNFVLQSSAYRHGIDFRIVSVQHILLLAKARNFGFILINVVLVLIQKVDEHDLVM